MNANNKQTVDTTTHPSSSKRHNNNTTTTRACVKQAQPNGTVPGPPPNASLIDTKAIDISQWPSFVRVHSIPYIWLRYLAITTNNNTTKPTTTNTQTDEQTDKHTHIHTHTHTIA